MNETSFEELLKKLNGIRKSHERLFTSEDLESMKPNQVSKLTLEMMIRFTGLGTYSLLPELYDLIEHLDKVVSIPEDPNLEKYLHMTASLICITQFEGADFSVLPERLAKHLKRIIGSDPLKIPSREMQPSLQIATFLAYPLLEGVIRRKLYEYISTNGKVLHEFRVPERLYKQRESISNLQHELELLEKQCKNPSLKAKLSYVNELQPLFQEIRKWRNSLLHGELTASWHSTTLLLLTYIILLEV